MKQPKEALANLVKGADKQILNNAVQDTYLIFLLQTCEREQCLDQAFLDRVYQYANKDTAKHMNLLLVVSEILVH